MIVRRGSELPEGTVVYITGFVKAFRVWQSTIKRQYNPFRTDLEYTFDPKDELWATKQVREIWDEHPCRHPYCTLFGILYKKLEIRNYCVSKLYLCKLEEPPQTKVRVLPFDTHFTL